MRLIRFMLFWLLNNCICTGKIGPLRGKDSKNSIFSFVIRQETAIFAVRFVGMLLLLVVEHLLYLIIYKECARIG